MIFFIALFVALFAGSGTLSAQDTAANADPGFTIHKIETNARFDSAGTGERSQTVQVKIQSEAAVRQLGVLSFEFDSESERVEVDYVRVQKADGSTVATPATAIQETASSVASLAPMYSHLRQMQVPVRSLASGDTLEYKVRWICTKAQIENQFWYQHDFAKDAVVDEETLIIDVPAAQAMKVASPGSTPQISESSGRRVYTWKTSNPKIQAPDAADKTKPNDKPKHSVEITTFKSWEEVGSWYRQLASAKADPTPAIRAKEAELIKGLTTDSEKEHAIYDFVSTKFRYISVSFGVGRYQPHAAEEVLANLYGDCKDKHTLLQSLLQAAGIEAAPALMGEDLAFNADVPSPAQFNHVITVIPNKGDYVWLDSTPEVSPFGMLQANLRDVHALIISKEGAAKLVTTPAEPSIPGSERFQAATVLKSDGTLTGHFDVTVRGDPELLLRSVFHEVPPSQWQEAVQRMSQGLGFGGKVSAVDVDNPQDTTKAFHYGYDYTREKYSDWDNLRITPPFPPMGLPETDEKTPESIELGAADDFVSDATVKLPEGFSIEYPRGINQTSDFAEYHSTYSVKDSVLTAHRELKIRKSSAPRAEYKIFSTAVNDDIDQFMQLHQGGINGNDSEFDSHAQVLMQQAVVAIQNRDFNSARDALTQAEHINPNQIGLWGIYAALYAETSQPDKALESARKELDLHPGQPELYRWLATLQSAYKHDDDAITSWQGLVKISPADHQGVGQLSSMLVSAGRFDEALKVMQNALAVSPDDIDIRIQNVDILVRAGKKQEGSNAAKELPVALLNADQLNNVAYPLAEARTDLPLAVDYAQRSVTMDEATLSSVSLSTLDQKQLDRTGELGLEWDTLGWALFLSGDSEKAEKYLMAAWKLGQHAVIADHLGQLYEKQSKKDAAIHMWKLALAADGSLSDVRDRLNRAELPQPAKPGAIPFAAQVAELSKMRSVDVTAFSRPKGTAEFFVLLSKKGVEDVSMISGAEDFNAAKDSILKASFDMPIPDDGPEKIARRGILSCSQDTKPNCQLVLMLPANTKVQ